MSIDISPAFLCEPASGQAVPAELWDAITEAQLVHWEDEWTSERQKAVERLKAAGVERSLLPQSRHWNWRRKANEISGLLSTPSFSVMCRGMTQGMMIVSTLGIARLPQQKGKDLVYVDYLETAPWNIRGLVTDQPRYQGVGSILMRAAIELSRNEGFKGRVGLHSLPQSNGWYGNACGMADTGADANYQNLRYFEMTPEQAEAFIAKGHQP